MIIPLQPDLEGLAQKRFFGVAKQVLTRQQKGQTKGIAALVNEEVAGASARRELNGQTDRYTACVRILGDLSQLRWSLVENGYGLELHSPQVHEGRVRSTAEVQARKEAVRKELQPRVEQQFQDKNVQAFLRQMERPARNRHRPVATIIADGRELQERLASAKNATNRTERIESLAKTIRPYLQLVETGVQDEYSGIALVDIWRYCRYTWSIPQTPIPGRKLLYLVRDAAHPNHAVMGIAALGNCAVQMVPRDRSIGWSARGLRDALEVVFAPANERFNREQADHSLNFHGLYSWLMERTPRGETLRASERRSVLRDVISWLEDGIADALRDIDSSGLASPEEIAEATSETIGRLRHVSEQLASERQSVLSSEDRAATQPSRIAARVPVSQDVLALEARHSATHPVHDSRPILIRKKRAFELARLLEARRVLRECEEDFTDPAIVFEVLEREGVRAAVNTAIGAIKGRRIGTNILEITTCGAVAPYNELLGGKLVALLMLSPQVAVDYGRRYGSEPTIIRSQLKNERVVPDNTLVWLGTTSLFAHGSSQYERLRLPAGTIAPDQDEIRYHYVGDTTGYGTVQFSDDTVRAVETVMQNARGYRDVNSVFGEGASPRLRKLRSGLDRLGFNSSLLLLHHQERRIYGVPLSRGAAEYLCGTSSRLPNYIKEPERYADATDRIVSYWRERWLARRLDYEPSWNRLGDTARWSFAHRLVAADAVVRPPAGGALTAQRSGNGGDDSGPVDAGDPVVGPDLAFWKELARAGANAIAEGLDASAFGIMHVKSPADEALVAHLRGGGSLVLTGNAGDGKTHLMKHLQHALADSELQPDFVEDATALMTRDQDVGPLLDRWRAAHDAHRGIVLAINQYPLYRLRRALASAMPSVSTSLEEQWSHRLVYAVEAPNPRENLLLVDLSLRNPLAPEFAEVVLQRILQNRAVRDYAASRRDPNFSFNYERLANEMVRERLLELFRRVIAVGGRATVRELWILCARLLFGSKEVDEPAGSIRTWYSERLFESDPRFPILALLRNQADPFGISHPHIDKRLEAPNGTRAGEWLVDRELPHQLPAGRPAMAGLQDDGRDRRRAEFAALKRRFYFEHSDGGENAFAFDDRSNARFYALLRDPQGDLRHLRDLIRGINLCYLPLAVAGIDEALYLWVGHRLDEQPTSSYIANKSIPRSRLRLVRPRLPTQLRGVFNYVADHVVLDLPSEAKNDIALRIDASLYATLMAVADGLPRHLVSPSELNRLDSFIDQLHNAQPEVADRFLTYNAESIVSASIQMSSEFTRYEAVRRLDQAD